MGEQPSKKQETLSYGDIKDLAQLERYFRDWSSISAAAGRISHNFSSERFAELSAILQNATPELKRLIDTEIRKQDQAAKPVKE